MSRRFALVIGNSLYEDSALARLKTPEADVHALATVLRDKAIGGFDDVQELLNEGEGTIRRAISMFFSGKKPDDLLLLYFSGHGVLDPQGRLFLAARDTNRKLLNATAIAASFITEDMDICRSKRQVLILDCCHSGAFARGTKGDTSAMTRSTFEGNGYGKVVMTASDSTQYALEGDQVDEDISLSLFTNYLLDGIKTGEADKSNTGWISVDEWYDYAYEKILSQTPTQTPKKWEYNTQGDLIIARNPRPKPSKPAELPSYLRMAAESEMPRIRLHVLDELAELLLDTNEGMAKAAYEQLARMAEKDDSFSVRDRAAGIIGAHRKEHGVVNEPEAAPDLSHEGISVHTESPAREEPSATATDEQVEPPRDEHHGQLAPGTEPGHKPSKRSKKRTKAAASSQQVIPDEEDAFSSEVVEREEHRPADTSTPSEAFTREASREEQAPDTLPVQPSRTEVPKSDPGKKKPVVHEPVDREDSVLGPRSDVEYMPDAAEQVREGGTGATPVGDPHTEGVSVSRRESLQQTSMPTIHFPWGRWRGALVVSLTWGFGLMLSSVEDFSYSVVPNFFVAIFLAGGILVPMLLAKPRSLSDVSYFQVFLLWLGATFLALLIVYPTYFISLAVASLGASIATGMLLRRTIPDLRWKTIAGSWGLGLAAVIVLVLMGLAIDPYGDYTGLWMGIAGLALGAIGGNAFYQELLRQSIGEEGEADTNQPPSRMEAVDLEDFAHRFVAYAAGSIRRFRIGRQRTGDEKRATSETLDDQPASGLEKRIAARVHHRIWMLPVLAGVVWSFGGALPYILYNVIDLHPGPILYLLVSLVQAISIVLPLMLIWRALSPRRLLQVLILWLVGIFVSLYFPPFEPVEALVYGAIVLYVFTATGLLLEDSNPGVRWERILVGWLLGVTVFVVVTGYVAPLLYPYIDEFVWLLLRDFLFAMTGVFWMIREVNLHASRTTEADAVPGRTSSPARSSRKSWGIVVLTGLGWSLGLALYMNLMEDHPVAGVNLVFASILAASTVLSLAGAGFGPLPLSRIGMVLTTWLVGVSLSTYVLRTMSSDNTWLFFPLVLVLIFALTGLLLRRPFPGVRWLAVLLGWILALALGFGVIAGSEYIDSSTGIPVLEWGIAVGGFLTGSVGTYFMHRELRRRQLVTTGSVHPASEA